MRWMFFTRGWQHAWWVVYSETGVLMPSATAASVVNFGSAFLSTGSSPTRLGAWGRVVERLHQARRVDACPRSARHDGDAVATVGAELEASVARRVEQLRHRGGELAFHVCLLELDRGEGTADRPAVREMQRGVRASRKRQQPPAALGTRPTSRSASPRPSACVLRFMRLFFWGKPAFFARDSDSLSFSASALSRRAASTSNALGGERQRDGPIGEPRSPCASLRRLRLSRWAVRPRRAARRWEPSSRCRSPARFDLRVWRGRS